MTDRPANQVWDAEVALANVDGYHEDLKELLHLWLGQGPRLLSDIQAAVAGGNTKALEMALHTLKGSLQVLGASSAASQAEAWEAATRTGKAVDATGLLTELEQELASLNSAITLFLNSP